jgi:hypothetical protein
MLFRTSGQTNESRLLSSGDLSGPFFPSTEVTSYFAATDPFVLSSLDEGLGHVIFKTMATDNYLTCREKAAT